MRDAPAIVKIQNPPLAVSLTDHRPLPEDKPHSHAQVAQTMAKPAKKLKFEEAMEQLDTIVEAMEAGEIGVEESIARYEEAMKLAAHCRKILDQAEQRIQTIQLDAAGKPEATPFEPPDEHEEDQAVDEP